jgi:hypothetical protein
MATCDFCGNDQVEKPIIKIITSTGGHFNPSTKRYEKAEIRWKVGSYCARKYRKPIQAKMMKRLKEDEEFIGKGLIQGIPQK